MTERGLEQRRTNTNANEGRMDSERVTRSTGNANADNTHMGSGTAGNTRTGTVAANNPNKPAPRLIDPEDLDLWERQNKPAMPPERNTGTSRPNPIKPVAQTPPVQPTRQAETPKPAAGNNNGPRLPMRPNPTTRPTQPVQTREFKPVPKPQLNNKTQGEQEQDEFSDFDAQYDDEGISSLTKDGGKNLMDMLKNRATARRDSDYS
jgi:hypothetical protein